MSEQAPTSLQNAKTRISMLRAGQYVPRYPAEPLHSSATYDWLGIQLERHQICLPQEWSGTIDGYQLCCNVGEPALVTWDLPGKTSSKKIGRDELSFASHGSERSVRWNSRMDLILLRIDPFLIQKHAGEMGLMSFPTLLEHRGIKDQQICSLLRMLSADVRAGAPAGALYGQQLGNALLTYLVRSFTTARNTPASACLPAHTVRRITIYIDEHLSSTITLQDLAREAGMSRFHFSRLFRNSTGETPCHYVVGRRLKQARMLLDSKKENFADIAKRCGFSSHSHLTALFRSRFGVTPKQCRTLC